MQSNCDVLSEPVQFRELPLFEGAHIWRAYWTSTVLPYIGSNVLEVGAGIGSATAILASAAQQRWLCLEPDAENIRILKRRHDAGQIPRHCEARQGGLGVLEPKDRFDTILYVDVLEHIPDDRAEMAAAAAHLTPRGHLIVVAPAHQFLFTEFDRAIGHYRRYSRASLLALTPRTLRPVQAFYLDSVGMLASLGNRLIMHAAHPPVWSIELWNRCFVPASRLIDPLMRRKIGKTVVAIWERAG